MWLGSMKFISVDSELSIPTEVAVCPVCQSRLTAIPDAYEQLFPGVNLFVPKSVHKISCVKNERHVDGTLRKWFNVSDRVGIWLAMRPVAVELGPEALSGAD